MALVVLGAGLVTAAALALGGMRQSSSLVLLSLAGAAFGAVGLQIWRSLRAMWEGPAAEEIQAVAEGRRRELEHEKRLILKAMKELEFDHEMGKVSDADFQEAYAVYRGRAIRVMEQLDAGAGAYREIIEREVRERLAKRGQAAATPSCTCGTANDADAVFCKKCGLRLEAQP